jgi:hypothetical protein
MTCRRSALLGSCFALAVAVVGCATTEDAPLGGGGTVATGGDGTSGSSTGGAVGTTGGEPGTTGGSGATGAVATTGGAVGTTGGSTGTTTGGSSTAPAPGEDGSTCLWDSECNSGVCANRKCACGNQILDGAELGVDCGGECPPCNGEACAAVDPQCGGGLTCEAGVCVPFCLTGWQDTPEGQSCLAETQPDRADCERVLDCMLSRGCGPSPCENDECPEDPSLGAMGRVVANEVYAALCQ